MKRILELEWTWYKLDNTIKWINFFELIEEEYPELVTLNFYAEYPVYKEYEKVHPLLKLRWINEKTKYKELINEDIFSCSDVYKVFFDEEWNLNEEAILKILEKDFN